MSAARSSPSDSRTPAVALGCVGLLLLVFLAFALVAKLQSALEEEIANRLRTAAALSLAAAEEIGATRPGDPAMVARLDELRRISAVSMIVLFDRDGRKFTQVTREGIPDAVPRQVRVVRRGRDGGLASRRPELDAAGGWTLIAPAVGEGTVGAALVRLDPRDMGALATARVLVHGGKLMAGVIIVTGILVVLRWARPGGASAPSPRVRASVESASDVDVVLGTMKEVVHSLKDSETDYRGRWTEASRDADHFRTTSASIVESISSGIVAFDDAGRITLCNRAAESVLAFDGRTARGRRLTEVFGEHDPVTKLGVDLLERGGVATRLEIARTGTGGEARWIGVSSSVLPGSSGLAAGGIFLVTDLTEARRVREAGELKDRLSAVGEMSAGIAHEIKNSLHSLAGFANLLREDAKEGALPLPVRGILDEVRALDAMVRRVLEFAKPSSFSREPVFANRLVEDVQQALGEKAKAAGVTVTLELDPRAGPVLADALAMRGAFVNLAANAIEAMAPGGTLTIATRASDGPSEEVRVSFRDTGPGIPEADREKVFAPFFSTKGTGIGLGLALVQKTVTDHGGRIQLRSRSGVGTEFSIHLPSAEAASAVGARA